MIAPDEEKKVIVEKLQASKLFNKFIKENTELDSDEFYEFAYKVIREIYGDLGHKNFRSISHAAPWFAQRQNILRSLLRQNKVDITYKIFETRKKLSYAQWDSTFQSRETKS